jgi:hypothetical protein
VTVFELVMRVVGRSAGRLQGFHGSPTDPVRLENVVVLVADPHLQAFAILDPGLLA